MKQCIITCMIYLILYNIYFMASQLLSSDLFVYEVSIVIVVQLLSKLCKKFNIQSDFLKLLICHYLTADILKITRSSIDKLIQDATNLIVAVTNSRVSHSEVISPRYFSLKYQDQSSEIRWKKSLNYKLIVHFCAVLHIQVSHGVIVPINHNTNIKKYIFYCCTQNVMFCSVCIVIAQILHI